MWDQKELLKCIWHAFTALDVDHRGKVSKSQLKVLSFNVCAVLKIPYNPVSLEEHFKDEDLGPLSNQGYMSYLSTFILSKVQDDVEILELFKFCWTLCYKKNISIRNLHISHDDAFKVWCIFNFLSEDKYPLIIITEEVEYLLSRLTNTMGGIWREERFAEYHLELSSTKECLTAWELIELVGTSYFKDISCLSLSTSINEMYQELILGILKQGYMAKNCHKRKSWTEYWFVLRPHFLEYYVSEDLMDIKGMVALDSNCTVESLPDKEGRTYIFLIKCADTSFELSVSDKTKKHEWIRAIEKCIQIQNLGLQPPHRLARLRRWELRRRQQTSEEEIAEMIKQLQAANESKQKDLEAMKKTLDKAAKSSIEIERRRWKTELDLQDRYKLDLEREKMVRLQMEEQVAQKSTELEHYLHRVTELEDMYNRLQEALEDERQAKREEEDMRKQLARLLEEEAQKRAELEQMHLQQQRALSQSQDEKQELEAQWQAKERKLQETTEQQEGLERPRHGIVQQYQEVSRKLQRAATKTKTWKSTVARHEGLLHLIQPGIKCPQMITNWGPAAFTDSELKQRKKEWQESKNRASAAE